MSNRRRWTSLLATLVAGLGALQAEDPGVWQKWTKPYRATAEPPPEFRNSPRFEQLLRAGNLYLSLEEAIALAIENNLDIEVQRSTARLAETDVLRTRGGGTARGLAYNLSEAPSGVGGLTSQLLTTASHNIPGTSVSTNPFEVGALGVIQTNLNITGTIPPAAGVTVPNFDPYLSARVNYSHVSTPQTSQTIVGVPNLVTGNTTAGGGYRQGFGSGALFNASFDNLRQTTNSVRSSYSPYTVSSLNITLTQPLLRGFGYSVNRRHQQIAGNERQIADLLFRQQLISTIYGVTRLYHDFVALYADVKVKEETQRLAQKLFEDTKAQVEEGTLAEVELARANAQVFATRLDLERARGSMEEQEAILKNVLTRRGGEDPAVRTARLIPVSSLTAPPEERRNEDELFELAFKNRPDLAQALIQITNSELSLKGTLNALKPQVDIVAFAQNNGMAGEANPAGVTSDRTFLGGYGFALEQILRRNYPVYGGGVQVDLPLRNRVAQADAARDQIQLRQTRIRLQQLRNQARLEVEDALIALRRAKAAYEAAVQARVFQEESLKAEQAKFEAGASTSYMVIQFQTLLAQSRSSELAAGSAYIKANAALRRATGTILSDYGISVEAARQGAN